MKRDMMQNDYVVEETGKDFPPIVILIFQELMDR